MQGWMMIAGLVAIGVRDILELDGRRCAQKSMFNVGYRRKRRRICDGHIKNGKETLSRGGAGLAGMKFRAEGADRRVEIRRKNEKKKGGRKVHLAVEESKADFDGDQGRAERSTQFKDKRGEKSDAKDAHSGLVELFADLGNRALLMLAASEEFERGESLQDIKEMSTHLAELFPLFAGLSSGEGTDEKEEEEQNGRRDEEDQA